MTASWHLPFTIAVSTRLRVDDIEARLPSKVFEILKARVHVSRSPGAVVLLNGHPPLVEPDQKEARKPEGWET